MLRQGLSSPANRMFVRRVRYASAAGERGSVSVTRAWVLETSLGVRMGMASALRREDGNDADDGMADELLDLIGGPERRIEVLDQEGEADPGQEPDDDADGEIVGALGPDGSRGNERILDDTDVVGLDAASDAGLLQALQDRLVQLLVGIGLPLQNRILDLFLVELLAFAAELIDVPEERLL